MRQGRFVLVSVWAWILWAGWSRPGYGAPAAGEPPPSSSSPAADLARLQAEVREQRQLIMQLMRVEKEHYDLLLRLVQEGRGGVVDGAVVPPGATPPAAGAPGAEAPPAAPAARPVTATLKGKVEFPGGALQDVVVYVENVRSASARGKTVEIAQREKRFVPEVTVVQRGTRVSFPNYDSVFHNVFSPSQPHPFDLGSYRAGEEAKAVEMTSPGVVDVYCNMHSAMHASVLVVPSSVYARVGADGSFHLDGVPVGKRKLVVWGPRSKPASQTVDLGATGAEVTVVIEPQAAAAHNNKYGKPYGSYP
jgi:plastocyanin